jgi:hypothetical protein
MNPVHIVIFYLTYIYFNIIFPFTYQSLKLSFPSDFPTKTLYAFLPCVLHASPISSHNLSTLITTCDKDKLQRPSSRNSLHFPVTSSRLNILLSTLFPNILTVISFVSVREQVPKICPSRWPCVTFRNIFKVFKVRC